MSIIRDIEERNASEPTPQVPNLPAATTTGATVGQSSPNPEMFQAAAPPAPAPSMPSAPGSVVPGDGTGVFTDGGLINFGGVTQVNQAAPPIQTNLLPSPNPEVSEQNFGLPMPVDTQFDPNSFDPNALFAGPIPMQSQQSQIRYLPEQPRNRVAEAVLPSRQPRTAGEVVQSRGMGWVRNMMSNVFGQADNAINFLFPLRGIAQAINPDMDFGEYGTGDFGLAMYLLDIGTNAPRALVLDILRGYAAAADASVRAGRQGGSLTERFRNFAREFEISAAATDPTPNDGNATSFFMQALRGDDQSFFNFQRDQDGGFNPLGVLGYDSQTFYREIDEYEAWLDARQETLARQGNTNWLDRARLSAFNPENPVLRRYPRAILALGLENITDPTNFITSIASSLRRSNVGNASLTPGSAIIRAPREFQYTPSPTVAPDPGTLGRLIRMRVRRGMSTADALASVARDLNDADLQRLRMSMDAIPRPDIVADNVLITPPRQPGPNAVVPRPYGDALVTPPPAPTAPILRPSVTYADIGRDASLASNGFPTVRTPAQRRAVVNTVSDVVPPNATHSQIDRIINALPPEVSDEVAVAARPIGTPVPLDIQPSAPREMPRYFDWRQRPIGEAYNPIEGRQFSITRTADRTFSVNYITADINDVEDLRYVGTWVDRLRQSGFADRIVVDLDPSGREIIVREYRNEFVRNGFVPNESNNRRLVWRNQSPRQPQRNVVESLATSTGRPRLAYTERVVQQYNNPPEVPRYRSLTEVPVITDELVFETYPFGDVARVSDTSFDVRLSTQDSLNATQRNALRETLRTAPDASVVRAFPESMDAASSLLDEGFVLREVETGRIATYEEWLNDVATDSPEPRFEFVYERNRSRRVEASRASRPVQPEATDVQTREDPQLTRQADSAPDQSIEVPQSLEETPQVELPEFDIGGDTVYIEKRPGAGEEYWLRLRSQDEFLTPNQAGELSFGPPRFNSAEEAATWVRANTDQLTETIQRSQDVADVARQVQDLVSPSAAPEAATPNVPVSQMTDVELSRITDNPPEVLDATYETIEQSRRVGTHGHWVREQAGVYRSNAFDTDEWLFPHTKTNRAPAFAVTISRADNGRWIFESEEHSWSELVRMGYGLGKEDGFRTLAEVKEEADNFGEFFADFYYNNNPEVVRYREALHEQAKRSLEPPTVNREQEAIEQLLEPDVVNDAEAYEEVAMTVSEDIMPTAFQPSQEVREQLQNYTRLREQVVSYIQVQEDLAAQLDEIRNIDPEDFYTQAIDGELPDIENIVRNLDENDPEVETLLEMFEQMVEEPTTRNVQRYLSQLDYTVDAKIKDNYDEGIRYLDEFFDTEDAVRQMVDAESARYMEDTLREMDSSRRLLEDELGKHSRGRCI